MGRPRLTQNQLTLSGQDKLKPARYSSYNMESGPVIPKDYILKCPSHYSKEVKKAWKAIVPSLIQMQVLSEQDLVGLKIMFDCLEEYEAQMKVIRILDETYSSEKDYWERRDKASRRRSKALDEWMRLAARYGIMPTERSRLIPQETEPKNTDPLDILMQG